MKSTLEQVGAASLFLFFTLDLERRVQKPDESDVGIGVLKPLITFFFLGLAAISIMTLWQMPLLLACVLCFLAWLKRLLFPIKWELLWFLVVGYMGATAETLIIQAGAWTYTNPQWNGIPIWLPAIWGLTATSLMTAYSAVASEMKQQTHP